MVGEGKDPAECADAKRERDARKFLQSYDKAAELADNFASILKARVGEGMKNLGSNQRKRPIGDGNGVDLASHRLLFSQSPSENTFDLAKAAVSSQLVNAVATLEFFVAGKPRGEGRHRSGINKATGRPVQFKGKVTTVARADVLREFRALYASWKPWSGPCIAEIIDCHQEPADCWPGKHCVALPDVDNSAKLVLDGLRGYAWRDDRYVTYAPPSKCYFPFVGKWVRLTFCDPVEKPKNGWVASADGWILWFDGELLGRAVKSGARVLAFSWDGQQLIDPGHSTGAWKNRAAAANIIQLTANSRMA